MRILKCLIRNYFIETAMDVAFEKIWYNFMVPDEVKKTIGQMFAELLMRRGNSMLYIPPLVVGQKQYDYQFDLKFKDIAWDEFQ